MRYIIAALVAAFSLGLFGGFPVDDAAADWTQGYPPCATEDSPGPCHWDHRERGGIRSFVVLPGINGENDDDPIIYVSR